MGILRPRLILIFRISVFTGASGQLATLLSGRRGLRTDGDCPTILRFVCGEGACRLRRLSGGRYRRSRGIRCSGGGYDQACLHEYPSPIALDRHSPRLAAGSKGLIMIIPPAARQSFHFASSDNFSGAVRSRRRSTGLGPGNAEERRANAILPSCLAIAKCP